jgi:hypothetical protein
MTVIMLGFSLFPVGLYADHDRMHPFCREALRADLS